MDCRVYLHSLGCRLNQSEVEAMARRFAAVGYIPTQDPAEADICILNTCAVTAEAERKTRHRLRALHRANPAARIGVVGCAATLKPGGLARLPGVAWVVPNEEKEWVVEIATGERPSRRSGDLTPSPSPCRRGGEGEVSPPTPRTRALVKVQDGCDNHCTYCVVRLLRGPARSRPPEEVVAEVQSLVAAGRREVVLTGVNLGAYGRDLGMGQGLARLIEAILSGTDLPRLRLSSLEPWDLDEGFFKLWADARLCRHLHLPLQSGCGGTLRRMGRPITPERYARLTEAARAAVPDLALTTDVMVGFPGEDEAAFAESLAFVERLGFARLHVFPFSPRPGTPAARVSGQVDPQVRRERARRMRKLGTRLAEDFRQRFVGREMEVLWERHRADGFWHGLTDNYLRVVTRASADLHNRATRTRLLAARDGLLVGEVVG
ncbi:MAG TPA: tRNA (N(6)-L-threonylcarbamoyladenosine(37)-C(2))-methylthiotransferase MtaB [Anaerolineales bacterium]|nr:tRNA (N(6)-L-threonylcarbamoyladenosine(37)-C(2))-methylthiotransferase MtaB [Anaerolineales bacterium]